MALYKYCIIIIIIIHRRNVECGQKETPGEGKSSKSALCSPPKKQEAQLMLTNPRDATSKMA